MYNFKNYKLWLILGICTLPHNITSFISKSYIRLFAGVLSSIAFFGVALMLSNINDSTKNAITKLIAYFFNPLLITVVGTFCYIGIEDVFYKNIDKDITLFSINFFIIIFILNIFFRKNNILFKKHL